ncbi:MAG: polysaccharide biosynthesis tyrosine autokinase [Bacteroidales bacterium]|nr:polysaccharide biosynthesis tyrosine autokinase [Bacteroidales bacterium]
MAEQKEFKKDTFVDLSSIVDMLKRYWWLFVASLAVCLLLAGVYIYVVKPEYLVSSKVLVSQDEDGAGVGAKLVKSLSLGGGGSKVDDEVLVFRSHDLRTLIAKELKTNCRYVVKHNFLKREDKYNNSPIEIKAPEEVFDTLSYALKFNVDVNENGDKICVKVKKGRFKTLAKVEASSFPVTVSTDYGIYVVDTTEHYKRGESLNLTAAVTGYDLKAEDYDKELVADLVSKKSNGIYLSIKEKDIQRGKDVINKLVELYNERCQAEKDEMAVNTGKFIDERLLLIYEELSKNELDIEDYKQKNNLTDMVTETQILFQKRNVSERSKLEIETQVSIIQMIKDFLSDPENNSSLIPFNAEFANADELIGAYNELILQKMALGNSAKNDNIAMRALEEQIDALRGNIQSSVDKTLESLSIKLNDLREQEGLAQGQLSTIPTREREFRELYRQQGIKNELYTFLLQKREENALVLAARTPKGKVVDKAYANSKPISLGKMAILFIAILFGLLIPIAYIYGKKLFTTKFASQEELGSMVSAPILGEISRNRHRSSLVVKEGRVSSIVELFRLLRNNVQFMLNKQDDKVILVTSSVSGEGKSFVSLNLAATFALLGKKVALVGMDIRNPRLHEYLGLKSLPGVTSYLSNAELEFGAIVQHCQEVEGLDVIVGGPIPPNPSELLLVERVKQLIETLRSEYDYVIIDSAPIAMVSDTFSLSRYADAVVYVTRANYTKRRFMRYLNEVIANNQLENVAVVLNDTNPKFSMGYGYGYGTEGE